VGRRDRHLPLANSEKDPDVATLWCVDNDAGAEVGMGNSLARLEISTPHQEILG
jgi:hypothetical protein